jgi:peptidoglycan DL-endopeptidase CwlO
MRGRGEGYRVVWRRTGWALLGGAVLTGTAVGVPGPARASNPGPPGAGSVSAAAGQVSKQAGALSAARVQLAAANARLASLRTQSEVVIERYDKTMVSLQQARTAYQAAMARLARASTAQAAAHRRVASLAAQAYEAGGGAGSMATMLGNAGGPQAYLQGANDEQQLARQRGDLLSQNRAATVVADVFRRQARQELTTEQTAARRAAKLKTAIAAAIARQQGAVASIKAATQQLEAKLGQAKAHEYQLQQARQAAGRSRSPATGIPAPVAAGGSSYGGWPSSYSLSQGASAAQGNIAANWALSQIGKPYQWGGAGPSAFDCSGLVMRAWQHAGIRIPRTSQSQWAHLPHVSRSQLRPGDLAFAAGSDGTVTSPGHVVLYIGHGKVIQAYATGYPVMVSSLASVHPVGYADPGAS